MFPNLTTDEVTELANKVGVRVARDFPGVEPDDIAAEALFEISKKAKSLKTDDPGYIYKVMEGDARRYASKERYDYMLLTAQYIYTPREVRALLAEAFFDPAMWDAPSAKDDRLSATVSGKTIVASLMDIKDALAKMPARHRDTIVSYFRNGEEQPNKMRVTRAVDSLTRFMNRALNVAPEGQEGPGTRRVMSNAEGQMAISKDLEATRDPFRRDAVSNFQSIREYEPADPPGTHFNWDKEMHG